MASIITQVFNSICQELEANGEDIAHFQYNWKPVTKISNPYQWHGAWQLKPLGIEIGLAHSPEAKKYPGGMPQYSYFNLKTLKKTAISQNKHMLDKSLYTDLLHYLPGTNPHANAWYLIRMMFGTIMDITVGTGSYNKNTNSWEPFIDNVNLLITGNDSVESIMVKGSLTECCKTSGLTDYPCCYFTQHGDNNLYMPALLYKIK